MESSINLIYLANLCNYSPKEALVEKLQEWGLIPKMGSLMCLRCGDPLRLGHDAEAPDGWRWICRRTYAVDSKKKYKKKKVKCSYKLTFRKGTFFEGSQLNMLQMLGFVNLWTWNTALHIISSQLTISKTTCVAWSSYCRDVVTYGYLQCPQQLGGTGFVVEMNDCKFGRQKYRKGHDIEGQWIIGACERGTGNVLMTAVGSMDADTLVPIIRQWILPGTTLISDMWRTYNCLANEGFKNLMVNDSINFADPVNGAHTNSIESIWYAAKSTLTSQGHVKTHLAENLARYIFMKRCRDQRLDRTREFFRLAGLLHDPRKLFPDVKETIETTECSDNEEDFITFA